MGHNKTRPPRMEDYAKTRSPTLEDLIVSTPYGCVPPIRAEPARDNIDLILEEICDSRVIMKQKLGAITLDLNLLRDDHHKLAQRVKSTEQALSTFQPAQTEHDSMWKELRKHVEQLQECPEDAKGRMRRNNICIEGLPEGAEGDHPTQFIETWLQTKVAPKGLSTLYTVEQAHCVPTKKLVPRTLPRPTVVKIQNYRDALLQAAWDTHRSRWLAPECFFTPITRCWCSVTGLPTKKSNDTSDYTALYMY
ncbi:hypothetical protein NDU88_003277 [Pleurodeles waltl]|uniref:Uncharacterized protein n=1 Tax=Pleurodeles waltl TaxID=8319 RepID=A0AAV7UCW3_PLEWA|nr:hypothetical protein NDU88_003277 [Pleurodeles waltl]